MSYNPRTKQFSHQQEQLATHGLKPAWGLLWEQGTGKSKELIDEACALYSAGKIDAAVVLAPGGVHLNWQTDELPKHVPEGILRQVRTHAWSTAKAGTKWHAKAAEELIRHKGFPWLLMTYDGLMTDKAKNFLWRMLNKRQVFYAADEAHYIKTPGSKRTIRATKSAVYAPYRRIATGTPVAQGPFDLYSQLKFLDEDFWKHRGFENFAVFKRHFGVYIDRKTFEQDNGYDPGYDIFVEYRNLDELQGYLKEISSRVLKDDVLDLPPKLYTKRYYELTTEQRRLMDELKRDLITSLKGGTVTAELPIVRLLRSQQICCGYVPLDSDEETAPLVDLDENPRLDLFKEIVEGVTTQAIVWARFRRDIDLIMEVLGDRAVRYDGSQSDEENLRARQRFQAGEVQWFVGNPAKGAEGLTLVGAKTVIYYNNSFRFVHRLQSEDRAHRIGQDESVLYIDLIAKGSPDEHVVRNLRGKRDIASQITGDELLEWL